MCSCVVIILSSMCFVIFVKHFVNYFWRAIECYINDKLPCGSPCNDQIHDRRDICPTAGHICTDRSTEADAKSHNQLVSCKTVQRTGPFLPCNIQILQFVQWLITSRSDSDRQRTLCMNQQPELDSLWVCLRFTFLHFNKLVEAMFQRNFHSGERFMYNTRDFIWTSGEEVTVQKVTATWEQMEETGRWRRRR